MSIVVVSCRLKLAQWQFLEVKKILCHCWRDNVFLMDMLALLTIPYSTPVKNLGLVWYYLINDLRLFAILVCITGHEMSHQIRVTMDLFVEIMF